VKTKKKRKEKKPVLIPGIYLKECEPEYNSHLTPFLSQHYSQ
jgi:hypothetical protein